MTTDKPLDGITVVAVGQGSAAILLDRLLIDLGARMTCVGPPPEPAEGRNRWLRIDAEPPAWWLAASKLVSQADVLVCDRPGGKRLASLGLVPRELTARHPELVSVQLSEFGLDGPWCGTPATELTLQSLAGLTAATGTDGAPLITGVVGLAAHTAALSGLIAVMAGLIGRERGAGGDYIDIAEFDSLLTHLGTLLPSVALTGRPPRRTGNRHGMASPWNSYSCCDAHIVICTMGEPMWQRLATAMGRPGLVDDPRFADTAARVAHAAELDTVIAAWTYGQHADDLADRLRARNIPCARIVTPPDVRRGTAARRRGLVTGPGDTPCSPLSSLIPAVHTDALPRQGCLWEPVPHGRPPLHGIRVLELGAYTAGPHAGRLLAQLGADVLKVEPRHGEGSRRLAQRIGSVGYLYFVNNAGKRSCRLDLADPRDRAMFDALLGGADLLLTNLAADTLAATGIAPEQVLSRHSLVHCAVTGHGLAAADRSVDTVIQAESGMMHLVGGAPNRPLRTPASSADVLGAFLAAAAATVSTYVRLRTGAGAFADVALFDAAVWATQDSWLPNHPKWTPQMVEAPDGRVLADTPHPVPVTRGPAAAVLKAALAAGLPAAPLHDLTHVVRHPQVAARRMVVAQQWGGETVLITGDHLRSLTRGTGTLSVAPVDDDDPSWLAPRATERRQ